MDRGVRESEMIDMSTMVIKEGKFVYAIFADVNVLNVDGNLFDATSYAVVAARLDRQDAAVRDGRRRRQEHR